MEFIVDIPGGQMIVNVEDKEITPQHEEVLKQQLEGFLVAFQGSVASHVGAMILNGHLMESIQKTIAELMEVERVQSFGDITIN